MRKSKEEKLKEIEKKIEVQQDALVRCKSDYEARVHGFLLQKLTDEWCELMK